MLSINLEWDANALAAPQSFRDAVTQAAGVLEAAITDPITVNVQVGYGEFDLGGPQSQTLTQFSLGGVANVAGVAYPALLAALAADASSASDAEAVSSLPDGTSLEGQATFVISGAVAKVLGALPANSTEIDGEIGFPTTFTGNGLVDAAIVELAHALGMLNGGDSLLNLVEYTAPGVHLLTSGFTSSTPAYFSIDGGNTNLANYDVSFDSTLFENVSGDPLSSPNTSTTVLTPLDLTELGAIGFNTNSTPTLPTPNVTPSQTAAGTKASITPQNISVGEGLAIPVLSMIKAVTEAAGDNITDYGFFDQGSGDGHLEIGGIAQPDGQWIYALDTQLGEMDYVGGPTPGSEFLAISAFDFTSDAFSPGAEVKATTTLGPPPSSDFNGDGMSDVLWQNDNAQDGGTGQTAVWLMDGETPTSTPIIAAVPTSWHVVGTGDFYGNGDADILWQNDSGQAAIWEMNGTTPTAEAVFASPPAAWHTVTTGDFNGDGMSDVVWQYENTANPDPQNGNVAIWEMNGTTTTAAAVVAEPGPDWVVVGTGDFNGDGKSDILWQYENGQNASDPQNGNVAIWEMNGLTPTATAVIAQPGADWHAVGTGDFNGDGKADILWQYENGQNASDPQNGTTAIWLMNGLTPTATAVIANPGAAWDAVGTGDYDGNGKSDILWQNTNGQAAIWEMNGLTPTAESVFASPPNSWHVIPA